MIDLVNGTVKIVFNLGSAAGEIFWWDLRNLEAPLDTLLLNPKAIVDGIKNDDKAFGVCFVLKNLKTLFSKGKIFF